MRVFRKKVIYFKIKRLDKAKVRVIETKNGKKKRVSPLKQACKRAFLVR